MSWPDWCADALWERFIWDTCNEAMVQHMYRHALEPNYESDNDLLVAAVLCLLSASTPFFTRHPPHEEIDRQLANALAGDHDRTAGLFDPQRIVRIFGPKHRDGLTAALNNTVTHGLLQKTFTALPPQSALQLALAGRGPQPWIDSHTNPLAADFCKHWLASGATWSPEVPNETRDLLADTDSLPVVLSHKEALELSPEDIETRVAKYRGVSVEKMSEMLAAGALSEGGFLTKGESLGRTIQQDALRLSELNLTRDDLSGRLRLTLAVVDYGLCRSAADNCEGEQREYFLDEAARHRAQAHAHGEELNLRLDLDGDDPTPWGIITETFMGYQTDPLHSLDAYRLAHGRGALEITITHRATRASVRLPDLSMTLIERIGFFQQGPYRQGPERIAAALGLISP